MKFRKRILITLGIGILLVFAFFFITESITKYTGFSIAQSEENYFEICLKEQDIALYINTNDAATTLKGIKLFDYLQYFEITNCAVNNQKCIEEEVSFSEKNINWIINSKKINKDIGLQELKDYSGCELISNK